MVKTVKTVVAGEFIEVKTRRNSTQIDRYQEREKGHGQVPSKLSENA